MAVTSCARQDPQRGLAGSHRRIERIHRTSKSGPWTKLFARLPLNVPLACLWQWGIAMENKITVVVIDDHPLLRLGIVQILQASNRFDIVGEGTSANDALRLATSLEPDVMLLEMKIPGSSLEAVDAIIAANLRTNVVLFNVADDEESAASAFRRGVRGYLLKETGPNELIDAICSVACGKFCISPQLVGKLLGQISGTKNAIEATVEFSYREEQVLGLLARGLSNKEIAFRLELREKTVKYYLTHVMRKLHVRNRVEAALYALRRSRAQLSAQAAGDPQRAQLAALIVAASALPGPTPNIAPSFDAPAAMPSPVLPQAARSLARKSGRLLLWLQVAPQFLAEIEIMTRCVCV